MKYLYKIYSGYDGFTPGRLSARILARNTLPLAWTRYLDVVEVGDEVWIYFHGPHRFTPGVYVKGIIQSKDPNNGRAILRVREHSTSVPLTDPATSARIAATVAARGLQVFVYPEDWDQPPECSILAGATSCANRLCDSCLTWKSFPRIRSSGVPERLDGRIIAFTPAYWVVPSRCYVYYTNRALRTKVRHVSDVFYRFKIGSANLAFPLALGIYFALKAKRQVDYDCVVPVPLSPDKAEAGELHRTLILARELSRLLGTKLANVLNLKAPISKHRLRTGLEFSARRFEEAYREKLTVCESIKHFDRILLLDDVATEGSTLRITSDAIRTFHPGGNISACTAGLMIRKSVVTSEDEISRDSSLVQHASG